MKKTKHITVKELLDKLYRCSEFNQINFTDGYIPSGSLSREQVSFGEYGEYANRKVLLFGFYNGNIEIGLYI